MSGAVVRGEEPALSRVKEAWGEQAVGPRVLSLP
jgi:hypothetical protein